MRTFLACFVLAAAIATPGIVVAATSSSSQEHAPSIGYSATILRPTGTAEHGPINPSLRPAVNAVKAAFAAKGIELTVEPLGGEAAAAFAIDPSSHCPTVINFEIGDQSSHLLPGACSSEASIQTSDGLTISYTPEPVGPTIEQALATLPR